MEELKPGVQKTKTKQMENEKWIGDDQKAGDGDCRTPLEQGERPTPAEVVTSKCQLKLDIELPFVPSGLLLLSNVFLSSKDKLNDKECLSGNFYKM